MTLFEYLSIAASLVFSFVALRLVAGLPHALAANRRYYLHVLNVCLLLLTTAVVFWGQWSTREVEWTLPRFLIHLTGPAMLYFLACTLVPDEPAAVESWEEYYFSIRRRYFGGVCVWAALTAVNVTVLLHLPLRHPVRVLQLGVFLLGVGGLVSDRASVHRIMLIVVLILVVLAILVFSRPGPLAA